MFLFDTYKNKNVASFRMSQNEIGALFNTFKNDTNFNTPQNEYYSLFNMSKMKMNLYLISL